MTHPNYPPGRKGSGPWDRLRPVRQDPLESMGFVSKGDNRLLDAKVQESFYHKIVTRYMQFCTRYSKNLDEAFTSILKAENISGYSETASSLPIRTRVHENNSAPMSSVAISNHPPPRPTSRPSTPIASDELATILTALRKLREGLLASVAVARTPVFSQRVHVFNIRLAILALQPQSYHPSLTYLLSDLHTRDHPLPTSELMEMTTYKILDLAFRQNDLVAAYALRYRCKESLGYQNRHVDGILRAVVSSNWVAFWSIRRKVDGYVRAMLHWYIENIRKSTLKAFGRAYLKCDLKWLLQSATGEELTWDQLVEQEDVGWLREGDSIIIRKPKTKP